MNHYCEKLVKPIRVLDVVTRVGEFELSREWNPVKQLGIPPKILLILEPLQVKGKDIWQSLDFHPIHQLSYRRVQRTDLFSASCRPQHESQKNLFFWHNISLAENCRRQDVTDVCCSISIDRSKKSSSRDDVYESAFQLLRAGKVFTVSQLKHRVSLVKTPSNKF
jgi:hypothetical protein